MCACANQLELLISVPVQHCAEEQARRKQHRALLIKSFLSGDLVTKLYKRIAACKAQLLASRWKAKVGGDRSKNDRARGRERQRERDSRETGVYIRTCVCERMYVHVESTLEWKKVRV